MRERARGFTLIELMIVVVVIGILAAIAFPAYDGYVIRSNRTVGKTVLMRIAGQQESFFVDRKAYASTLDALSSEYGGATVYVMRDGRTQAADSSSAIYSVTLTNHATAPPAYWVEATPIHRQTKDTKCGKLTYKSDGTRTQAGTATDCWR